MINTQMIKELRDATQAGMMDCKKALEENNGNVEKAIQWLREKGIAKAAKKVGAVAAEGIATITDANDKAIILELNCQTDFVAKNPEFIALAEEIKKIILEKNIKTLEDANKTLLSNGQSIQINCDALTGKIGEKISLRRFVVVNKKENETFGLYQHANNRVATLILLDASISQEVAKNVAMHAAAMAPKFIDKSRVNQEWLENEKKVLIEQTVAEGKPKEFAEKIVQGRVGKLLAEVCLEDQAYVKDPGLTIAKYLSNNGTKAIEYIRFEVGEGIEKKVADFAKEVAEQMNSK